MNSNTSIFFFKLFALSRSLLLFDSKMSRVRSLIVWGYLSRTAHDATMRELQRVHNFFSVSDPFPASIPRSRQRFSEELNKLKISFAYHNLESSDRQTTSKLHNTAFSAPLNNPANVLVRTCFDAFYCNSLH